MGIKGMLKEIEPSRRIALSKLALDHFTKTARPLRIAIDISIWNFEVRKSKGGTNPELRTIYQRLLKLLRLPVHPLFVFDGADKPPFKRDKATITFSDYDVDKPTKEVLDLFGYPYHVAPGEAEAECAVFQKHGIVDAVLTEDSDALMFGSRTTYLNWSSQESKGKGPKSHVDVYEDMRVKEVNGLDREGMILVAIMSGADYLPAGVPRCGPRIAMEAAKAGFGMELCKLSADNRQAIAEWKVKLRHELATNEGNHFTTKHKALEIPDDFPNMKILRYYTHPKVSSPTDIEVLREKFIWDRDVDVLGLRAFVARTFEWRYKSGTRHLMKGLAEPLLINALRRRGTTTSLDDSITASEKLAREETLVQGPDKEKTAFENDGMKELRVYYTPSNVVEIDLEVEENNPFSTELGVWDDPEDADAEEEENASRISASPKKQRKAAHWNPAEIQEIWVFEAILKVGVPNLVQRWEDAGKPSRPRGGPKKDGPMGQFVRDTKSEAMAFPRLMGSQDDNNASNRSLNPVTPSKSKAARNNAAGRPRSAKRKSSKVQTTLTFATSTRRPETLDVAQKPKRLLSPPLREFSGLPLQQIGSSQDPIHLLTSSPEPAQALLSSSPLPDIQDIFATFKQKPKSRI